MSFYTIAYIFQKSRDEAACRHTVVRGAGWAGKGEVGNPLNRHGFPPICEGVGADLRPGAGSGKALLTQGAGGERLGRFLRAALGSAERAERIVPLEGDASDRRYIRVFSTAGRPGGSRSYVVMVLERPWDGCDGMEELPFVNIARYLNSRKIPVPEIYYYDAREGMLLIEDLGSLTLQRLLRKAPWHVRRGYYREALEILIAMQDVREVVERAGCYAARRSFTAETFFNELVFFLDHAVAGLWRREIRPAHREALEGHFMKLCRDIAPSADVFTHRDYHSRNLMVSNGRIRVLDFQDARMGTIYYDLASLLRDSYVALGPKASLELLCSYRRSAPRGLVAEDEAAFIEAFDRTSIQRNLKAVGTFAYQACRKGKRTYLAYIPRTLRYVASTLAKYPDLYDLRALLEAYVPGLGPR